MRVKEKLLRKFTTEFLSEQTGLVACKCSMIYEVFIRSKIHKLKEVVTERLLGKFDTDRNYRITGKKLASTICEEYGLKQGESA